eukprot:1161773-Pelagomonas_calceolata.AAC.21
MRPAWAGGAPIVPCWCSSRALLCVQLCCRDSERALLAQVQRLLHSAEAAPEAEVSAQELREDAVLAHVVQGEVQAGCRNWCWSGLVSSGCTGPGITFFKAGAGIADACPRWLLRTLKCMSGMGGRRKGSHEQSSEEARPVVSLAHKTIV